MLLYVVLGVVVVLGVFIMSFQTFVRNETAMSRHLLAGEAAWQVSRAGVAAGLAWFENVRTPCPLRRLLMEQRAEALEGASAELPVEDHGPLQAVMMPHGEKAWLKVTLELHAFQSLNQGVPRSPAGVLYGNVEKRGILQVVAEATVEKQTRVLVGQKEIRVVCTVPYVVSKFTLFAGELRELGSPTVKANHLDRLVLSRTSFERAEVDPASPSGVLRLFHGDDEALEDRGFVFLGSDGERVLNLAYGDGPAGEAHHLLRSAWEVVPTSGGPNAGYRVKFLEKGFFTGIRSETDLLDHYPLDAPPDDPPGEGASLLQLLGSPQEPSATVVLGNLRRRFLMLRYLRKVSTGQHVPLPWSSPSTWGPPPSPWPAPQVYDASIEGFDDVYDRYAACMSSVWEEPYSCSVDQVAAGDYAGMLPPRALAAPRRVTHPDGITDFLYLPERNDGRVVLSTASGTELFRGDLRDMSSADLRIPERATFSIPAERFAEFMASEPTRIPGILHVTGGGVTLDRPLRLADGGIICADGPVTVSQAPAVAPGGRALVLVSLLGDVTVTTEDPVQASLVALRGTLRKGSGQAVHVEGAVALGWLDPGTLLRGGGDVVIRYDGDRLDPTRAGGAYAVTMAPERTLYER